MTSLSFLFGLWGIYFLFNDYGLFLGFMALHIIADALDGVVARVSGPTILGEYLDHIGDSLINLFLIIKIAWYLGDYFAYLVAVLFFLAQLIYFLSRCQAPCLFTRTLTLIMLAFSPLHSLILILTYLTNGVSALYSLAKQIQWGLSKQRNKP